MTLAQQALGSVLRFALAWASGYLVREGIWTPDEAGVYVEALAAALAFGVVSLAWSLWQKWRAQQAIEGRW